MAQEVRLRGGTTAQHNTFTGAAKEVTVDTTKNILVVHDGATPGGHPVAKQSEVDASISTINDALALKANADDVTDALELKADADDVTSALALKADAGSLVELDHPGQIGLFARNTAPTGWLKANGAAISRTAYASLFAVIGTTFGEGDGSTTFNLPDLRGEFVRGWDDGRGVDAGRGFGSVQTAAMLNHTHSGTTSADGSHTHGLTIAVGASGSGNGLMAATPTSTEYPSARASADSSGNHTHTLTTGNPSTGGGSETRPRNVALLYCIKF